MLINVVRMVTLVPRFLHLRNGDQVLSSFSVSFRTMERDNRFNNSRFRHSMRSRRQRRPCLPLSFGTYAARTTSLSHSSRRDACNRAWGRWGVWLYREQCTSSQGGKPRSPAAPASPMPEDTTAGGLSTNDPKGDSTI